MMHCFVFEFEIKNVDFCFKKYIQIKIGSNQALVFIFILIFKQDKYSEILI